MKLLFIAVFSLIFLCTEITSGLNIKRFSSPVFEKDELGDAPVDESENGEDDQAVKGSINALKVNEKIDVDDKNPTLQELKKAIEDKLKEKKKEMEQAEEKKKEDKVVNLKPKKGDKNCENEGNKDKDKKDEEKDSNKNDEDKKES